METSPSILKNLLTKILIYIMLVCIYAVWAVLYRIPVNIMKLIVRPITVIKSVRLLFPLAIVNDGSRTIL